MSRSLLHRLTPFVRSVGPGVVTGAVGNPDRLDRPTTAVLIAGDLFAVNGRFAVPPTPQTEYSVTRIFLP